MGWVDNMKDKIRSWLNVQEAEPIKLNILETFDFEANALKNRLWYRGDGNELHQFYDQVSKGVDKYMFWASKSSPGMEMRKVHTGLPGIIIDTLASIVLTDLNNIEFKNKEDEDLWENIAKENDIKKLFENSVKETLYVGDGAYKVTFERAMGPYPIIEYYPGDQVDFTISRGRIREVIFKTVYKHKKQTYILEETYGYGYIKNKLFKDNREVDIRSLPQTEMLCDYHFAGYTEDESGVQDTAGSYMMAVPIMVYKSSKYKGRGHSIFDRKIEAFDSFDETWSQWMDALRAGRSKEYIPDSLLPRDPNSGEVMKPNAFDNRYIKTDTDMREGSQNRITLDQPTIPHDSYVATYITALDLCLQGIISPSTIGVDVKKLDNAEAQREKEKATLYTRNAIIEALTEDIKALVTAAITAYRELNNIPIDKEIELDVTFGEYANPSFESQVETVGKAKTQGIMSVEACVDELYGDSRDDDWKKEEVARLKTEQGITEMTEPAVNHSAGSFDLNIGGAHEGKGNEPVVPNGDEGVQGPARDS